MAIEEGENFLPSVQSLLRPISVAPCIEERVAGAVVTVEFVILAKFLEYYLGAIDLIGRRICVVVTENAKQRAVHPFGQIDRRHWALIVEVLEIVDNDIAAPAIDHSIDAMERAGGEISVAAAGAESDEADFAVGIGLRTQVIHRAL